MGEILRAGNHGQREGSLDKKGIEDREGILVKFASTNVRGTKMEAKREGEEKIFKVNVWLYRRIASVLKR